MGCCGSSPPRSELHVHIHQDGPGGQGGQGNNSQGDAVAAGMAGAAAGAAGGAAGAALMNDDGNSGGGGSSGKSGGGGNGGGGGGDHGAAVEAYGDEDGDGDDGGDGEPVDEPEDGGDAPDGDAPDGDAPDGDGPPEDGGDGGDGGDGPPADEAVDMYGAAEPDDSDFNKDKDDYNNGESIYANLPSFISKYFKFKSGNKRNGNGNKGEGGGKRVARRVRRSRNGYKRLNYTDYEGEMSELLQTRMKELNGEFEVKPFWKKSQKARDNDGMITIVTQCSLDRLKQLNNMCLTWDGIISVSVFVPNKQETESLADLEKLFNKIEDANGDYKCLLDIHLLYGNANKDSKEAIWYPINKLRNLSLNNSLSKYLFLLDIDFIPSKDLQANINNVISNREYSNDFGNANDDSPFALVIPAFEHSKDISKTDHITEFPLVKSELSKDYDSNEATAFHVKKFKFGHSATDYGKFFEETPTGSDGNNDYYKVSYQLYFEPYIIVRNSTNLRRYDERFTGYGFNKIVHIAGLSIVDQYNFYVLRNGFVIAPSHSKSKDFVKTYRSRMESKKRKDHIKRLATIAFDEMYAINAN